ncbi:hypothetical protein llap_14170 [Limosa lapponica baueri]|uniref:Uncharacterized protein n=1 Tax=Limosa lapponica baueri TaxID=1758121 RepID=A0A2I0TP36_LIMLA|nr:hypothetical protein llap_14170 [Limosa lapponica baueri]
MLGGAMRSEVFLGPVPSVVLETLASWKSPPLQLEHIDSSNIHVFCLSSTSGGDKSFGAVSSAGIEQRTLVIAGDPSRATQTIKIEPSPI